jgi:acetone carboxylase gamma subunit
MKTKTASQLASEENLRLLIDGKLPYEGVKKLIRLEVKDEDRFWKYLKILQEKVSWDDKILLRLEDHLYIVQKDDGMRVVKCECGQEFGDYRANWKLSALVYARKTPEEFLEVRPIEVVTPDPEIAEIREFYCPGCLTQLSVELVPHGYPFLFDMLPDLEAFYRDFLNAPLERETDEPLQDKSTEITRGWTAGK